MHAHTILPDIHIVLDVLEIIVSES